jgi:Rrf2 family iron-sulfur cluster assembly transcriptional regulator
MARDWLSGAATVRPTTQDLSMRLTTKGRFAVTAMIDLALHNAEGPVTLAEISERQKISLSYLEQLFGKLRRQALVSSVRGPGGGYNLAKALDTVSVADIIVAVDEPIDATQCGGKENCRDDSKCITHDLWMSLNDHIFDYLRSVTLGQLVVQQQAKDKGLKVVELKGQRPQRREESEPVSA